MSTTIGAVKPSNSSKNSVAHADAPVESFNTSNGVLNTSRLFLSEFSITPAVAWILPW